MVQLLYPYMTTGKIKTLTRWTFVGKVMCSDFEAQENKVSLFPLFPRLFAMKWWDQMPWLSFSECWHLSQLFHSPLSLSSRGFLFPLHFLPEGWCHLHIWGYWYFSQQSLFQLALHPASPAFLMMYSSYELNKQGDNIQPWSTAFLIWNQFIVPCPVLPVATGMGRSEYGSG